MAYFLPIPNGKYVEVPDHIRPHDAYLRAMEKQPDLFGVASKATPEEKSSVLGNFFKGIGYGFVNPFIADVRGVAELGEDIDRMGGETDVTPGRETGLGQFAERAQGWLDNDSGLKNEGISGQLGQAVGSMGSFLVPGKAVSYGLRGLLGITRGARAAEFGTMAGLGALGGVGEAAVRQQQAKEAGTYTGDSQGDINADLLSGVAGASQAIPIEVLLRTSPVGSIFATALKIPGVQKALGTISKDAPLSYKRYAIDSIGAAMKTGGAEGAQEAAEGLAYDAIERGFYNNSAEIGQSIVGDAALGGGAGAMVSGALSMMGLPRLARARGIMRDIDRQDQGVRDWIANHPDVPPDQPPTPPQLLLPPPSADNLPQLEFRGPAGTGQITGEGFTAADSIPELSPDTIDKRRAMTRATNLDIDGPFKVRAVGGGYQVIDGRGKMASRTFPDMEAARLDAMGRNDDARPELERQEKLLQRQRETARLLRAARETVGAQTGLSNVDFDVLRDETQPAAPESRLPVVDAILEQIANRVGRKGFKINGPLGIGYVPNLNQKQRTALERAGIVADERGAYSLSDINALMGEFNRRQVEARVAKAAQDFIPEDAKIDQRPAYPSAKEMPPGEVTYNVVPGSSGAGHVRKPVMAVVEERRGEDGALLAQRPVEVYDGADLAHKAAARLMDDVALEKKANAVVAEGKPIEENPWVEAVAVERARRKEAAVQQVAAAAPEATGIDTRSGIAIDGDPRNLEKLRQTIARPLPNTPVAEGPSPQIEATLADLLERYKLPATIKVIKGLANSQFEGSYDAAQQLIKVVNDLPASMPLKEKLTRLADVLRHEIVHAMFASGYLGKQDYQILRRFTQTRVRGDSGKTFYQTAAETYTELYAKRGYSAQQLEEVISEEAIAEAFRHWMRAPAKVPAKPSGVFGKIWNWLKELVSGGPTFYDEVNTIFGAMRKGEIQTRAQQQGAFTPSAEGQRAAVQPFGRDPEMDRMRLQPIFEDMREHLDKLGLKDIRLETPTGNIDLTGPTGTKMKAAGSYHSTQKLIAIAANVTPYDTDIDEFRKRLGSVLNHEAVHALVDLGVVTTDEFRLLAAKAAEWPDISFEDGRTFEQQAKATYDKYYGAAVEPLAPYQVQEEAIAEIFRAYADYRGTFRQDTADDLAVKSILDKIIDFFKELVAAIKRSPRTPEQILSDIWDGTAGERPRNDPTTHRTAVEDIQNAARDQPRYSIKPKYSMDAKMGERVPDLGRHEVDNGLTDAAAWTVSERMRSVLGQKGEQVGSFKDDMIIKFQDYMYPAKKMIKEIKEQGGKVTDIQDFYLRELLYHGRVGEAIRDAEQKLMDPILKKLKARDGNISFDDLEDYLIARHAPERNEHMLRHTTRAVKKGSTTIKYPIKDGSGLSDQKAEEIMGRKWDPATGWSAPTTAKMKALDEYGAMIDAVVQKTNQKRVEYGLIPTFDYVAQPELPQFKYYVPLQGFFEEEFDPGDVSDETRHRIEQRIRNAHKALARSGGGFKTMGREDERMGGRKTKANDVIANLFMQHLETLIRGEKNLVGNSFLRFVEEQLATADDASGMPAAEVLQTMPTKVYVDDKGVVRKTPNQMAKMRNDILVTKVKGEEVFIKMNNPQLARAMNHLWKTGQSPADGPINFLGWINRNLARLATQWNPEFILVNMIRDFGTASLVAQKFGISTRAFAATYMSNARAIAGDIWRMHNGNPPATEWGRLFDEMRKHGGTTEYLGLNTLEEQLKKIDKAMSQADGGPLTSSKKAIDALANVIESANFVAENISRLVAYKLAKDKGMTSDRAAEVAKTITVNFNKGGELKTVMNSLFLFYNAALQGSVAVGSALATSSKLRKMVGGIFMAGLIMDMLNAVLSADDEDGVKRYDKLKQWELEHSLIIPTFGLTDTHFLKVPMPFVFNAVFNAGRAMGQYFRAQGGYKMPKPLTPMDVAGSILGTLAESANPLGGSNSFLNFVAPTIVDPFIDYTRNRDFADRPIKPSQSPFSAYQKPESQLYWANTTPEFVKITQWLNKISGGSDTVKGAVDVSPAAVDYWFGFVTGATGKFAQRTWSLATHYVPEMVLEGKTDITANDIPFARRFVTAASDRQNLELYFDVVRDVATAKASLKAAIEARDPEALAEARERFGKTLPLVEPVMKMDRQINLLRSEIKKLRRNDRIEEDAKRSRIEALEGRIQQLTGRVNKLYVDATSD